MSDNTEYLETTARTRLGADIMLLMFKGAAYACAFVLALWLVVAVIAGIGRGLPDDARMADDPTPNSFPVAEEEPASN